MRSSCCHASGRGRPRTSTTTRSHTARRRCCSRRSRTRSRSSPQSSPSPACPPTAFPLGSGPVAVGGEYVVVAEDYPNEDFQRGVLPQLHEMLTTHHYRLIARRGAVVAYHTDHPRGAF